MKHYCKRDRRKHKREHLVIRCPGCKFTGCHLWWDYNGEEDKCITENIVNSNILNLDEIQKTKLCLDLRKITEE